MALPVLQGLKARYTDCHSTFFVETGFEAGLLHSPYCDEIAQFPRKELRNRLNSMQWRDGVGQAAEATKRLTGKKFDVVINLCQHTYISYFATLFKGSTTLGRHFLPEGNHAVIDPWSLYLYAVPFSRRSNSLHAVDVYRRIAGVAAHCGSYGICLTEEEKKWARTFLTAKGIDYGKKIMVLQAGAAFASKTWPVEHFITLGNLLVKNDWQIVLTGAPQELDMVSGIFSGIGSACFKTAGETTFRQSITLCSMAQGCVTGDTAQMHGAAGLGVPVYALFGATNPVETGPYGNGHWVFSAHCPDRPCFNDVCKTSLCMKSITPQTVFNCIVNNDPGANPRCDVYKTVLEPGGDFQLTPVNSDVFSFYNNAQAASARCAFGEQAGGAMVAVEETDRIAAETTEWIACVELMGDALDEYLRTKTAGSIQRFESIKASLTRFSTIGAFWTALLNLRLNGIPLLDPLKGVEQSREVCRDLTGKIKKTLS